MLRRNIALILLFLFAVTVLAVSQQAVIKETPIKNVPAADGEKMYLVYCASCHGKDGAGSGPAASALKALPTDLTVLARQNKGKFPSMHVQQLILGDEGMTASHGSKEMPVWRGLFMSMCGGDRMAEAQVQARVLNLTNYVAKLQKQ